MLRLLKMSSHTSDVDLSAFRRDILAHIQHVPLSRLRQATALSLRYVSLIRRAIGRRTRVIGRASSTQVGAMCCAELRFLP
jgi:hypothetical protein